MTVDEKVINRVRAALNLAIVLTRDKPALKKGFIEARDELDAATNNAARE